MTKVASSAVGIVWAVLYHAFFYYLPIHIDKTFRKFRVDER